MRLKDDSAARPTALSICSGIGGLDLAVRSVLDARVVCYLERDAYCQAVLLERMEEEALEPAPVFPDLCSFDGRPWSVDLIFGGIPCQPHSVAGKQLRGEDERDLLDDFLRLVGEVGPRLVAVENVRGFVAGDGLGRLLGGLAELGFDAEWQTLQAAEVGAPHRRERVFVLAYRENDRHEQWPRGHSEWENLLPTEQGVPIREEGWSGESSGCGRDVAHRDRNPLRKQPGRRNGTSRARTPLAGLAGEAVANTSDDHGRRGERGEEAGTGTNGERRRGSSIVGEELGHAERPRLEERGRQPQPRSFPAPWPPGPEGDWEGIEPELHPAVANPASRAARTTRGGEAPRGAAERNAPEPAVRRVADGPSSRVDRLRALGNAVVPAQAAAALEALIRRML